MAVGIGDGVAVGIGDGVAVGIGDGVAVGVGDGVAVRVGDGVAVRVGDGVAVRVCDGVAVRVGDGVAVRVGDGVFVGIVDGVTGGMVGVGHLAVGVSNGVSVAGDGDSDVMVRTGPAATRSSGGDVDSTQATISGNSRAMRKLQYFIRLTSPSSGHSPQDPHSTQGHSRKFQCLGLGEHTHGLPC